MVSLISPNGVEVRVDEAQAAKLRALGYADSGEKPGTKKPETKKAAPKKRGAKERG